MDKLNAVAYVDGTFNIQTKECGFGWLLFIQKPDGEIEGVTGKGNDLNPELIKLKNVGGEILAMETLLKDAGDYNVGKILVCYNYAGIAKWPQGEWKPEADIIKNYVEFVKAAQEEMVIEFEDISPHANNLGIEVADYLAQEAVGLIAEDAPNKLIEKSEAVMQEAEVTLKTSKLFQK